MNKFPNFFDIIRATLTKLIEQLGDFIPRLIFAIIILLIGYIIARIIAYATGKILEKIGLNKVGDKLNEISIVKQLRTEIKLSVIVSKVLYYFILLAFVTDATRTLGISALTSLVEKLVNWVPQLIVAAIMLQIGILVADVIKKAVISICKSFSIASGKLIGNIVFSFFLIITLISSLAQAGINTTLLESTFNLVIGGIVMAFAVGYGLASKDILSNILSSFYSKSNYKEGQTIEIDGVIGEIIAVDNTSITLQTEDSQTIFPLHLLQTRKVRIFNNKN